jgi:hypothetical protein
VDYPRQAVAPVRGLTEQPTQIVDLREENVWFVNSPTS